MIRISKRTRIGLSRLAAFRMRPSRGVLATLALTSLLFAATNANAACGSLPGMGSGSPLKLPMLGQAVSEGEGYSNVSYWAIVGLWHVVYTSGGSVFNETLDQWHADGTEFENAYLPVAQGNICFGVWKPTGPRTVRLHHIGWTYDPTKVATANGTFTLDETNTLAKDGKTYTGMFTFKVFDLKGDEQGTALTGTIAATRITVN